MDNCNEVNILTGNRLRECRKESGKTLEQLAEATDYSVQHLIRIEKGRQRLTLEAAEKLSSSLGVRKEYLLSRDPYKRIEDRIKNDITAENEITDALFSLLKAMGYSFKGQEIIFKDIATSELYNLKDCEDVPDELEEINYIGDINGYVVFEEKGKTKALKSEDFISQYPVHGILDSIRLELTYYDYPDKVVLTDKELNSLLEEILDFIEFIMDRQKEIRKKEY